MWKCTKSIKKVSFTTMFALKAFSQKMYTFSYTIYFPFILNTYENACKLQRCKPFFYKTKNKNTRNPGERETKTKFKFK